jgi:tRNA(fMet)-specific endonuclease VapC
MKCLDTDLLIAILRMNPDAEEKISQLDEESRNATTAINAFELYYGANKSQKKTINLEGTKKILSRLDILPLDEDSAEKAGEYFADLEKRGLQVEFRDALVAAISARNHLTLVTRNKKHYSRMSEVSIESW